MKVSHIPRIPGIYCITHIETDRRYIGSSRNIYARLVSHRHMLRNNAHPNPKLQASVSLYGLDAFAVSVIEETYNLLEREQYWITFYSSADDHGYNLRSTVSPTTTGYKASTQTRQKMSERRRGKGNSFFGRKHSPETRALLRERHKGRWEGDKNPFAGRRHTDETRAKLREAARKRTGEKNGFTGRSWSEPELADALVKMKSVLSERMTGTRNPFYGKAHDRTKVGKRYRVTDPNGIAHHVLNLRLWCENYGHNFETVRHSLKIRKRTTKGWLVERIE